MGPTNPRRSANSSDLRATASPAVIGAIAVGVAIVLLRPPGIGERSLWLDEALSVSRALRSPGEIVAISAQNQNPPVHPLLLSAWVDAFGSSEAAVRMPSLLASAATAAALFVLATRFFGLGVAVGASLLFAASEPQLYYAREARAFALVGLLCTISYYLYFSLFERPTLGRALALGVVNAAAMYCHFAIGFAFLAQLACAIVAPSRRALGFYVASQGLALALFAPWLGAFRSNLPEAGSFWLEPPTADSLRDVVVQLAGGPAALAAAAVVVIAAGAHVALRGRTGGPDVTRRERRFRVLAVAAWAVLPIVLTYAVSQRTPVFRLRYDASLGWFLLVAIAAAALPLPALARIGVAVVVAALAATRLDWVRSRGADWRRAVTTAVEETIPSSMIIVAPEYSCLPFGYYADPDAFADPDRLEARLAEQRVLCTMDRSTIDFAALGWPARVILVVSTGAPPEVWNVTRRLEQAGYRSTADHRLQGIDIAVASRAQPAPTTRAGGG